MTPQRKVSPGISNLIFPNSASIQGRTGAGITGQTNFANPYSARVNGGCHNEPVDCGCHQEKPCCCEKPSCSCGHRSGGCGEKNPNNDLDRSFTLAMAYVPMQCFENVSYGNEALQRGTIFDDLVMPLECQRRGVL